MIAEWISSTNHFTIEHAKNNPAGYENESRPTLTRLQKTILTKRDKNACKTQ